MYDEIISLLAIKQIPNEVGDLVQEVVRREVFAEMRSIGMKEKYQAFAAGLNPELVFVLADYLDYQEEQAVEYGGKRYSVLRMYRKGSNELEITVVR